MGHSAYANSNGNGVAEKYYLLGTIGLSVIVETFKSAAYLFISTGFKIETSGSLKDKIAEGERSFAFIRGTGLEICIQEFELDLDADELRKVFYTMFCRRML